MSNPMVRGLANVASTLATVALVMFVALSGALAGGNNGTLKVHDLGSPDATPNNEPKVCAFNLEAFGLDANQDGWLVFTVQGGDGPHGTNPGGPFYLPPASDSGFSTSVDSFNRLRGPFVDAGHYKGHALRQIHADGYTDEKAQVEGLQGHLRDRRRRHPRRLIAHPDRQTGNRGPTERSGGPLPCPTPRR